MSANRRKDANWILRENRDGTVVSDDARLAVLMDIRDELKTLNALLSCTNFVGIPTTLRTIARNTKKETKK